MIILNEAEKEVARHVLWYYGVEGGYRPGSFSESLLETMHQADSNNLAKLLVAFPEYRKPLEILRMVGVIELARMLT